MPDKYKPTPRFNFENAWPSAAGGTETHSFTIKIQDAPVGRAREMTEGTGAFGAARTGPMMGHEATHTLQQGGSRPSAAAPPQEEVALVFHNISWDLGGGTPPDIALKTRTGQVVSVARQGRKVIEGRLKSVARHGHTGQDWVVTLTGVRRS